MAVALAAATGNLAVTAAASLGGRLLHLKWRLGIFM